MMFIVMADCIPQTLNSFVIEVVILSPSNSCVFFSKYTY